LAKLREADEAIAQGKSLAEAKYLCNRWRLDYNHRRSQRALGNQTPAEFASECDEAVLPLVERAQVKEKA